MKVTRITRFVLFYYTDIAHTHLHIFSWPYSWSYFSVYFSCKLQNHKFKIS